MIQVIYVYYIMVGVSFISLLLYRFGPPLFYLLRRKWKDRKERT